MATVYACVDTDFKVFTLVLKLYLLKTHKLQIKHKTSNYVYILLCFRYPILTQLGYAGQPYFLISIFDHK